MTQSDPQLDLPADLIGATANGVAELPAPDAAPSTQPLRKTAARGAAWTVVGFAARLVLRFGFNLLLTRLVAPKVFGVMAIINTLIISLHMFSDLGISQCVIHHERGDDPRFLNTAWSLQVIRGCGLWLLSVAMAWPAAWFYEEPALRWLIPVAGASAFFDGVQSTAIFTLNRRLHRGRLVLLEVVPYTVMMTAVVAAIAGVARRHPGGQDAPEVQHTQLLLLVCGTVSIFFVQAAASYWLLRGRTHRFGFESTAIRALFHFGGWVFLSTGCGFLATQADQLVIGKVESFDTLGIYRVASQLAALPAGFIFTLCAQLVFPLYSRMVRDGTDAGPGVAGVHRTLGVLAGWLVTGLIVAGPTFIECLYRGKYQEAGGFIQFLAGAAWFTMLQSTGEAVLLSRGQARLMALAQVLKLAALIPLMSYGYRSGGLIGLVIGYGAAEALRYVAIAWAVRSLGQRLTWTDAGLTALVATTAGTLVWLGPSLWSGLSPWVQLGIQILTVTAVWAAVFGVLYRRGRVGLLG
jgi:O-antigen/teichoic acid export membrane protein